MPLTNKYAETISDNSIYEFYKHRKILSCISDGIGIYTKNITKYTIATLIPTLIVAILISVFSFLLLGCWANESFAPQSIFQSIFTWTVFIFTIIFLALHTCVTYVFVEYRCIKKRPIGLQLIYMISFKRFPHIFFFYLINICTCAIAGICIYYIFSKDIADMNHDDFFYILGCVVVILLVAIYSLPYNIVLPSLMLEKVRFLKGFIKGYKLGISNWVKNFKLFVLLLFIKLILGSILFAPMFVNIAILQSYINALINGDNAHLPESFIICFVAITFLTTSILIYFTAVLNLSYAYLYSSAITDKKEKESIPIV